MHPLDTLHRPLRDLRISVTDRCNFRCPYCMPKEVFGDDYVFLPRDEILTLRGNDASRASSSRSASRNPADRRRTAAAGSNASSSCSRRSTASTSTLTTNASLLAEGAGAPGGRARPGHVSLDSLDDATFRAMNDVDFPVARVLEGIDAAAAGGSPIKINVVVKRGVNDDGIVDMARYFRGTGHTLRFIEYMDVGTTNGWRLDDVVPAAEIVERIDAVFPLEPVEPHYRGEVAQRYRYLDGGARSASSPPSRSRSAATARGRGSPPTASSSPACSPPGAPTCARCSAPAPPTTSSATPMGASGRSAPTATPRFAARTPDAPARSRCPTSADSRRRRHSRRGTRRRAPRAGP